MYPGRRYHKRVVYFLLTLFFLSGCVSGKKELPLFEVLEKKRTGLDFSNDLSYSKEFNLFNYMYFYNGGGIGAGDFNKDGLTDLFFASNQHDNKLYLNSGNLHFEDVTRQAHIPNDGGWSTGVSVADINHDGLLDIYVCRVGQYELLRGKNQLLINQGIGPEGIPVFADKAGEYGLDFSGFSTHAAFFDYDNDGDLDMFLLNHSIQENRILRPRKEAMEHYDPLSGNRLYRNDEMRFTEVTRQAGIGTGTAFGLGIVIADISLDGYPDIYIGNDFHENDYLYINQQNGTFKEEAEERLMHTSQFSMGVDVADINNDGFPEITSMDMLPYDPGMLKRSLAEDAYNIFNYKVSLGYSYQYARNNLQLNRRNGLFSETGLYSGVYATDWSWAPLWMDFDNDGLKDLFVSNGIPKRMNDIDYINFVSSEAVREEIQLTSENENNRKLIEKFPEIKIPNKFFRNRGDLSFQDEQDLIGNNQPAFSNGSIYADLDNDGDLDIVVNNIDNDVLLYENKSSRSGHNSSVQLHLKGPGKNTNAIGAKAVLFANGEIRTYEKSPARGFMSSMEIPLHIGLEKTHIDSIFLIWPDNTFQSVILPPGAAQVNISWQPGLPKFDFSHFSRFYHSDTNPVTDITRQTGLNYLHEENKFVDFYHQPLMPHQLSSEGPALAVGDINHDNLEDVFIGASKDKKSGIFLQQASGEFIKSSQPLLDEDSTFEDIDANWADFNNDGNIDLVVASGGNELTGNDLHYAPRVYLNNGKAGFSKHKDAFPNLSVMASCIISYDINQDGYTDLFIGGRGVPDSYGAIPRSYLLLNDKTGRFSDATASFSKELVNPGFVTNAVWYDIDKDRDKDLLLSLEWGGITAFINEKGRLISKPLTDKKGWWNFILPCDIDKDGDIDLVAGNLGLNSRLKASVQQPLRMYYYDFDGNGRNEQVLTYYFGDKEITFASKAELEKQLPELRKKYLYAADLAKASVTDLFGEDKLARAALFTADYLANAVLINQGNGRFETKALPWQAQLTSFKDAVMVNANNDDLPDILLLGNYYDNNIAMGRYDADYGTLLINNGNGNFSCEDMNGVAVKGQVRRVKPLLIAGKPSVILARNNDSTKVLQFAGQGTRR